MIYRTLHSYILKELLRVFLLTASALTTLMAFGGMFRPITKQGIDVKQVMVILVNLMPAMLAYAIPIAALFAAVLVYWRMSTDNELTACRAGGISFKSLVLPAFILGVAVAGIDLVFVNYVVPRFLQSTERAVLRDLGALIVSQVGKQERFQYERLMVSADRAELVPTDDPDKSQVVLYGFAGTYLDSQGKPVVTAVGEKAILTITNLSGQEAAEIDIQLENTAGFDPAHAFKKVQGSVTTLLPDGRPFRVPSFFRSKPKFLNWVDLRKLSENPESFPNVAEVIASVERAYQYDQVAKNAQEWWSRERGAHSGWVTFYQSVLQTGTTQLPDKQIRVLAGSADIRLDVPSQESLVFKGDPGQQVRIEEWEKQKVIDGGRTTWKDVMTSSASADEVDFALSADEYTGAGMQASLRLRGHVTISDLLPTGAMNKRRIEGDAAAISGLDLRQSMNLDLAKLPKPTVSELRTYVEKTQRQDVKNLAKLRNQRVDKVQRNITSELHSRGSFALSCLTLVLLGAALGILMRGRNPLAVFVVGFMPAILLMLLITAGRQMTEGNPSGEHSGIVLIWAGNGVLLVIVTAVYAKLLRR